MCSGGAAQALNLIPFRTDGRPTLAHLQGPGGGVEEADCRKDPVEECWLGWVRDRRDG
jgi:hypothetical protein